MAESHRKNTDHMKAKKKQKEEEITIVSSSDAVVHPWAMMIERFYTPELATFGDEWSNEAILCLIKYVSVSVYAWTKLGITFFYVTKSIYIPKNLIKRTPKKVNELFGLSKNNNNNKLSSANNEKTFRNCQKLTDRTQSSV